jgi:hypothetical protein
LAGGCDGTVALILVDDWTVLAAALEPRWTAVVPVKLVPLIATTVPERPLVGVKLVIEGALPESAIVKVLVLWAVPAPVVMVIGRRRSCRHYPADGSGQPGW